SGHRRHRIVRRNVSATGSGEQYSLRSLALWPCWAPARTGHPTVLLAGVILISGFFSAFLINDAICLALTPLVLNFVTRLRRNPLPYLLAVAMASNIGSTATITGNPQNIMIGSFSQIPYAAFAAALWPVAAFGLLLTFALLIAFF